LLAGGLLLLQAGGALSLSGTLEQIRAAATAGTATPMSRLLDQVRASAMTPRVVLPQPERELPRSGSLWVPERFVSIPGESGVVRVPAHWEHRISDREVSVPPLVILSPEGSVRVIPGGVRRATDPR